MAYYGSFLQCFLPQNAGVQVPNGANSSTTVSTTTGNFSAFSGKYID